MFSVTCGINNFRRDSFLRAKTGLAVGFRDGRHHI
jgi:hypothetical protein